MKKHSIFLKYLIFFIIAGYVPMIISAVYVFRIYENQILDNTVSGVDDMFLYLSSNIQGMSNDFRDIINNISSSDDFKTLQATMIGEYKTKNDATKNKEKYINRIISASIDANSYTKGAIFVGRNNEFFGDTRIKGLLRENYNAAYLNIVQNYFEKNEGENFISTHMAPYYNDSTSVITYCLPVTYRDADEDKTIVLGIFLVDIYPEAIGKFFDNINKEMMGILYLADNDGNCIYSINEAWIGRKIYEFNQHLNSEYSNMGGIRRYMRVKKVSDVNWVLVCGINENYYRAGISTMKSRTVIALIVGLLCCLLISFYGTIRFSKPINSILRGMKNTENGCLDNHIQLNRHDELGEIADSFNLMLDKLRESIDKVYVLGIKQKEAQLEMLKAQIRPHFLYNTLGIIHMRALENDDEQVGDMISALAEQFRYVIDSNGDIVEIDEEIKMIEYYFKIVTVRYGGKIKLEVMLNDRYRKIKIPKLTIQTIVENAVVHGLRENGGKVKIGGFRENDMDVIEIVDDGVGINQEMVKSINCSFRNKDEDSAAPGSGAGLGLKNINQRLKMYYGNDVDMSLTSLLNVGTSVRIEIRGDKYL